MRDLGPVLERRVGHHVGHLDDAALRGGLAARAEAEPHAHLAEEGRVALGPVVHGGEAHQLRCAVDHVHAREARADERTDAVQGELEDLFGPVGREERVYDLADRDQLAESGVGPLLEGGCPVARHQGWPVHAANMVMEQQ